MTVEPLSSTPEVTAKVVDGALRAIARYGLTKLTVDDVAREAGISRATLYRYFPGRGAVLAAVVEAETESLQRGLDDALGETTTLAEALAAVAGFGARAFADHAALQHLLATEPGTVLPHLCFTGADSLLGVAADRIAPHLCRFMGPLEARRTGEWLARIVLSYGLAPPPGPADTAVLSVVREFVIPAAEERSGQTGG
ncbi:MAG TPA: TetR/AcrR family transcriptional regulator [Acidimicrobiia bacterium]|jgi:AcrR family transcriptional regulator|nr:TetR/AcrR family transcriptional regulator [Acidimicrobiia bacterium]